MSLDIHFLNVGHGDCTFVDVDDHLTMIDINTSKDIADRDAVGLAEAKGLSLSQFKTAQVLAGGRTWEDYYRSKLVDPVEYYRGHFDGKTIFRYVQTHPDMDHMKGLHRFFLVEGVQLLNMWDTDHARVRSKEDFESGGRGTYEDWHAYELLRAGRTIGGRHKVLHLKRGDVGDFWTPDGMKIFSPTVELVEAGDKADSYNNASYVVRIDYAGRRVILPGDVEGTAQADILKAVGAGELKCDVLKAPHHGRQSGYHEDAAKAMSPEIVVCSVGEKPETDATDEYAALGAKVVSTRNHGTIKVQLWFDGEVWVENGDGQRIAELPPLA